MENEILGTKDDIIRICWWMRGGITYEQALNLTRKEKEIINNLIKENMETSKKTGTPIF